MSTLGKCDECEREAVAYCAFCAKRYCDACMEDSACRMSPNGEHERPKEEEVKRDPV